MSGARSYRRDIDGIRAIAVLSVIAYHFGLAATGGFVGVDIFFVISGFLIGSHIYAGAIEGDFSYATFYAKRAKRIVPALVTVLVATFAAMLVVGTPRELRDFGRDAVASILSISNITLYRSIDYFRPTAETNPLLMTWSLGVEEQFYIVAPVILLLLVRLRQSLRLPALAAIAAASLLLAAWQVRHSPQAAFYLLPPRAWELGVGVLLGLWRNDHPGSVSERPALIELRAALGLVLVLAPVFLYEPLTPFPGLAAIPPVVGAALLLACEGSFINRRLLSSRVATFFGLISYSLYLWHWPLISIARLVSEAEPSAALRGALCALSIVLAWISYRFIETPFRRTRNPQRISLRRYALSMLAVAVLVGSAYATRGFAQRWPAGFVALEAQASEPNDPCLANYGFRAPPDVPECRTVAGSQDVLALVGDSHASALAAGLKSAAAARGMGFEEMTKSSCPFLQDVSRAMPNHPAHFEECASFNRVVLARLLADPKVTVVVIAGFWHAGLIDGGPFASTTSREASRAALLHDGLAGVTDVLRQAGKKVVILKDVPFMDVVPMKRAASCNNAVRAAINGVARGSMACEIAPANELVRDTQGAAIIESVVSGTGAVIADPAASLCGEKGCRFASGGRMLYVDQQHLSAAGSLVASTAVGRSLGW